MTRRAVAAALLLLLPLVGFVQVARAHEGEKGEASACGHGQAGGVSTCFRVVGEVEDRTRFDLDRLRDLPAVKEIVAFFGGDSFTGALLWDVLQSVGVKTDPDVKNDILRKVVVITGSDGYQVAFGAGEFHPDFGAARILVAYQRNGAPLEGDGFARIVIPGDTRRGGRFVSNIVKIEVRSSGHSSKGSQPD